jgi:hypothetical protein
MKKVTLAAAFLLGVAGLTQPVARQGEAPLPGCGYRGGV